MDRPALEKKWETERIAAYILRADGAGSLDIMDSVWVGGHIDGNAVILLSIHASGVSLDIQYASLDLRH